MLSENVVESLVAAALDAYDRRDRRSDQLKRQVFTAVDELKAGGTSPEQIIVIVRTLINAGSNERYAVDEHVASWCVERYGGPGDADPSSMA